MREKESWRKRLLNGISPFSKTVGTTGAFAAVYIAADTVSMGMVSAGVAIFGLAAIWGNQKTDEINTRVEDQYRKETLMLLKEIHESLFLLREIKSLIEYLMMVVVAYVGAQMLRQVTMIFESNELVIAIVFVFMLSYYFRGEIRNRWLKIRT